MILADTCVVIWLASDPSRLSKTAADAIVEARRRDGLAICGVTLYEVAWLAHNGRISVSTSLTALLAEIEARFMVLPLTAAIAQLAMQLPSSYPSDPMDRIIGATALNCCTGLLTPDRMIRKSKAVPVIW